MPVSRIEPTPAAFLKAVSELGDMKWREGIRVEEIASPQRIAPFSLAIEAEFSDGESVLSNGRLILLHDPAGNETWEGTFRVVSYARSDMDLEMVADPLLPDVSWSWMQDALDEHQASHHRLAGTVTASYGKAFGAMEGAEDQADVEIRSSWTPALDDGDSLTVHLLAWQDLLGHLAGRPPLPKGVVQFPGRTP